MVRVGGRPVVIHGRRDGMQLELFWWKKDTKDWEVQAWGIWPGLDLGQGADLWWDANRAKGDARILIGFTGTAGMLGGQWAVPLAGPATDPDATFIAGQEALSDPPRACSGKADDAYEASIAWGKGHAIVIRGDERSMVLSSRYALLRAPPGEAPCAYAYDAGTPRGSGEEHHALIAVHDLAHASLFRKETNRDVHYRPMSCRFEAGPAPLELATAVGFAKGKIVPY
jgi:hypothetical protein